MDTPLGEIVRAAVSDVHAVLGGGLGEPLYQNALAIALRQRGRVVETEVVVPIAYRGVYVGFVCPDLLLYTVLLPRPPRVRDMARRARIEGWGGGPCARCGCPTCLACRRCPRAAS